MTLDCRIPEGTPREEMTFGFEDILELEFKAEIREEEGGMEELEERGLLEVMEGGAGFMMEGG